MLCYRVIEKKLDELVPKLNDLEIMENVSPDNLFITPTKQETRSNNWKKPIPQITLRLSDKYAELGIIYNNQESIEIFKNIFRDFHKNDKEQLLNQLKSLDINYETLIYYNERNKKPQLVRKYITSRFDITLLETIIEEVLNLSKGGIQIQNNRSVYVSPKIPRLYITRITFPLTESIFLEALDTIKPIYSTLMRVKTQREIISDRLRKPKIKQNLYREFIEKLNEARKQDLISAEKRREFNKKWREEKDYRASLMEQLEEIIKTKSET
jgi:hypothetical protein